MTNFDKKDMQVVASKPTLAKQIGFTLIELSIVLVIIGLIVGGVLVGQDLIKAAEIRATVAQYEKYNSAMNTFRTKYNGMPGDLATATANSFGINPSAGTLTGGGGNGDSLITDASNMTAGSNFNTPHGETVLVWQQLSAANLVDGSFGASATVTGGLGASPTPALYFPAAKMGRGNYWIAGSSSGLNYYALANVTALTAGALGTATYTSAAGGAITPVEAFNIDTKLDDGVPNTGIVQARGAQAATATVDPFFTALYGVSSSSYPVWTTATTASAASGDCVTTGSSATDTANAYARGATPGNTPACKLRLRFN